MNIPSTLLLAIALANTAIGMYVWRQQPVSAANRSFAFLAATIASWTVGIALAHHGTSHVEMFTRYTFATASLIPFAILLVFHTFPNERHLRLNRISKVFAFASIIFSLVSLTPAIVRSAHRQLDGLTVQYGALHTVYGVYICASLVWSFSIFLPRYLHAAGLTRLQFRYFALGLIVPGLGVTVTNLLIPLVSQSSRYGQYGPYFALIFLAFTAHALIRYRFLDIRLVLQRSATFLLALAASVVLLGSFLLLLARVARWTLSATELSFLLLGGIALGLLLQPLRTILTRLLDSYAYRARTDYPKTLREASDALTKTLDFDSLVALIVSTVLQATRAERAGFYLQSGSDFILRLERHYFDVASPETIPRISATSELVHVLRHSNEPLVAEEIARRSWIGAQDLLPQLKRCNWAVLVPVQSEHRLIGILGLGRKLSGDPFFPDDLAFLSTIAGQATTAITNAGLYQQVVLVNEYLNNILRTMESGVIAASQDGAITLFNAAAERMTGLHREIAAAGTIDSLPLALRDALTAAIRGDIPQLQLETTLLDRKGRISPVVCSTSPLRDSRGTILGAVLVFSDLTTLKHLEAQKQQAERLASLGALASGIAHEIKNPLVAIKTFAELLPDRFGDEEFRQDFSRVAITEIARIDELIAKLGGLASSPHPPSVMLDITEPIEDTLALLRGQLEQKEITLRRFFHADHPCVSGDPAQLKQLFLNIFINAIQSMSPHGELSVRVMNHHSSPNSRLVVDISDTGAGIPNAILSSIFDPFVTTKPLGGGLGLAICRNITDAHRGTITAKNNSDGPGATISLDFPLSSPRKSTPEYDRVDNAT